MSDGAVIFVVSIGFFVNGGLGALAMALVAGLVVGLAWHVTRAGRTLSPMIAFPLFLWVAQGIPIFGLVIVICLSSARGVIRESASLFSG